MVSESHRARARAMGLANRRHGLAAKPIWVVWRNMRARCQDPKHQSFGRYGARGIKVCHAWEAFANFLADMGDVPADGYELDRIDNNGNYEKKNCRWATRSEQARNRRSSRPISWGGLTQVAAVWAADPRCSVSERVLRERILRGWSAERAITAPSRREAAHA